MRALALIPAALLVVGCGGPVNKSLVRGEVNHLFEEPVYLSDSQEQALQDFLQSHEKVTEPHKINFLLSRVRDSKVTFIRNGNRYQGLMAMQWLRWKMMHPQYKHDPVNTAKKFVDIVCDRSLKTGIPYEIILENGQRLPFRDVMASELHALENGIAQRAFRTAAAPDLKPAQDQTDIPLVAVLLGK